MFLNLLFYMEFKILKMRKIYYIISFFLISAFSFSCSGMEENEETSSNYEYMIGNWQLKDIVFLSTIDPENLSAMEEGKAQVLQQVVKMSFQTDNSVVENVNGQYRNGHWEIKSDSIVEIQFEGLEGSNPMLLRHYDENQLQFVIGTSDDQSLYIFNRVE